MPIPRPVGFSAADDYKMSLSFDHDRFVTPWVLVMGPKAPEVPLVNVHLVRTILLQSIRHPASRRSRLHVPRSLKISKNDHLPLRIEPP